MYKYMPTLCIGKQIVTYGLFWVENETINVFIGIGTLIQMKHVDQNIGIALLLLPPFGNFMSKFYYINNKLIQFQQIEILYNSPISSEQQKRKKSEFILLHLCAWTMMIKWINLFEPLKSLVFTV